MKDEFRSTVAALIELALVLALGFSVMSGVMDLTPLARHFFGFEAGPPQFAMIDPLYPLLRGILSLCLLGYVIRLGLSRATIRSPSGEIPKGGEMGGSGSRDRFLSVLLWCLIAIAVITPAARDMFDRAVVDEAPGNRRLFRSRTHDGGVLQTELAIEAVLDWRNPYSMDYGDTVMARARDSDRAGWRMLGYERNPALEHLPYLPAMFVLPLGLKVAAEWVWGWYDQRLFYILGAFLFVWLSGRLVDPGRGRRIVWLVTGLSPLLLPFIRIGRNDVVLLALIAGFALALKRHRIGWAGVVLGLACAAKQFAWVLVPFFAIWLWREPCHSRSSRWWALIGTIGVFVAFCLPFFIAGPDHFMQDALFFSLGMTPDAYPLRPDSLGIASLVLGAGWATSLREGFPLWIFQLAVTLPLAVLLGWRLFKFPSPTRLFLASAVVAFVGLYFSSFFALNYLATPVYLLMYTALDATSRGEGRIPPSVGDS